MIRERNEVPSEHGDGGKNEAYQEILARYIEELTRTGFVDPDAIFKEHPDCAADLLEDLQNYIQLGEAGEEKEPVGTLGDYTLRRQIGRGGMGIVYDAWENSMDRRVALKVLPSAVAADSRSFLRFMQEAKTAGQLVHPNIVAVYAMGVKDRTPYYAMEFVEGQTLSELIERDARAPDDAQTPFGAPRGTAAFYSNAAGAFAGAAEGLQHAHANKVIHRDIKPSNLILDSGGRLRILDFGLARHEGQQTITLSGDIVGTVLYMSPEQARAKRARVDHRTDIYSLGATMYEFFTGRPPFKGSSHQDTISRILTREPAEPHRLRRDLPRPLETIILKCLRKEPDDRFGTAEALAQDLRRFARGDPIEARPQSALERFLGRVRRQIVRIAVGVLILLLVAVFLLFVYEYRVNRRERLATARQQKLQAFEEKIVQAVSDIQLGEMNLRAAYGGRSTLDPRGLFGIHRFEKVVAESPLVPIGRAIAAIQSAQPFPEGTFEAYYHWARALALRKDLSGALEKLDRLFEKAPQFVPGRMLAAELLRKQGRKEQAGEQERRAERAASLPWQKAWLEGRRAESNEDWKRAEDAYSRLLKLVSGGKKEPYHGIRLETRLRRGGVLLHMRAYQRALSDFNVANEMWPEAFEPYLLAGRTYYLMEKHLYAEEVFRELYRTRRPEERDHAAVWIGVMYSYHRDHEKALTWARRITNRALRDRLRSYYLMRLRRFSQAEAAARASIARNPRNAMAYHMLALALKSRKRYAEAIKNCEKAVKLDPMDFGSYHTLGTMYYEMMNFPKAVEYLQKALELKPDYSNSLCNLGAALVRSGHMKEGLKYLKQSLRIAPSGFNTVFIALTLERLREPGYVQRQMELYRESVRLDPTLWLSWFNWGVALYQNFGKYEEALEKLLRAQALYADYHTAFAHLARVYEHLGREEEAVKYYRKSLDSLHASGRRNIVEYMQLGNTLAKTSDLPEIRREGLALLLEASKLWPGDHRVLGDYAGALIENEKYTEARAVTARALKLHPGYVLALKNRAVMSQREGKPAEALADFLAAIRLRPVRYFEEVYVDTLDLLATEKQFSFGGELGELRKLVEAALGRKNPDPRLLWHVWLTLSLVHRKQDIKELFKDMARVASIADVKRAGGEAYAEEIRRALERLHSKGNLRINCGGGAYRQADGTVWESDRFFFGGRRDEAGSDDAVAGTNDHILYTTNRKFPFWERSAKAYRIPVLPGNYRVTLHFAESYSSDWEPRIFDIKLEGTKVFEGYDTRSLGAATADRRAFVVEDTDAVLEIEFKPRLVGAFVNAIEVERL